MINEDYEREFLKDLIYLQEEMEILKQELMQELNRKPANIMIISDIKNNQDANENNNQSNVLSI